MRLTRHSVIPEFWRVQVTGAVLGKSLADQLPLSTSGQKQLTHELRTVLSAIRAKNGGDPDPRWLDQLLRARRGRNRFFNSQLFADPAWDMLLELYAAEVGQRRVSVTNLCIASGVPSTTAHRCIEMLTQEGLIGRRIDPLDRRRKFVHLSRKASEAMRNYFSSLPREIRPV